MATERRVGSILAVAASMIEKTPEPPPTPAGQAEAGPDTTPVEPGAIEEKDDQIEATSDDSQELGEDEAPDTEGDERPLAAEGGDTGDAGTFHQVKVDGETQEVSLADLKASYSGNTVIAKRLQEATEAKNDAVNARDMAIDQERHAAREMIQQETDTLRQQASQLSQVYETYREALLAPQVNPPDASLRQTDPIKFLTEMEAYRQDQDRLRGQEAHMTEVTQRAKEMEQQAIAQHANAEAKKMIEEVPAMADPAYRKAQLSRVMDVGRAVGYTDAEIRAGLSDRRLVYLAMLAAEAAENIVKTRNGGKAVVPKSHKAPAPSAVARRSNGQYARKQEAFERAAKTGSVKDVAATMMVSAPQNRGRQSRQH